MLEKREAREMFILAACAMGMHATHTTERAEHVARLKATAEALADELGLKPAGEEPDQGDAARWRADFEEKARAYAVTYEELQAAKVRVAELEQDLEKATAPKARAK